MMTINRAYFLICALLLTGCGLPQPLPMKAYLPAPQQAQLIASSPLHIAGWWRQTQSNSALHVYIEGDGRPWLSRGRVAFDPTPVNPISMHLALADQSANVLYLARPCQFAARQTDPACQDDRWWTQWRYNPEVLTSLASAIDKVRQPGQPVVLVGYSGGGTMAALLAERLHKAEPGVVKQLITLAGNLSVMAFNQHHSVSSMSSALDPITIAASLSDVPQVHIVGEQDEVVPQVFAEAFVAAQGRPATAKIMVVDSATHEKGWGLAGLLRPYLGE